MTTNAMDLGKKLLKEVEVASLCDILESVRNLQEHPAICYLNVPSIDRLLAHINTRAKTKADVPRLAQHIVLEIISSAPGSGMSQLLYYLIAVAVLPEIHGGKGAAVVLMDTNGRFDVERLAKITLWYLHSHIQASASASANAKEVPHNHQESMEHGKDDQEDYKQRILHRALDHVHIFRPSSLTSLVSTIAHLPTYLLNSHIHLSNHRPISLLAINSSTAFFWQERMSREDSAFNANSTIINHTSAPAPVQENGASYQSLVSGLIAAQKLLGCTIVTTAWSHNLGIAHHSDKNRNSDGNDRSSFRPSLPWPWSTSVTRITVSRDAVNKFPVGMAVAAAEKDREMRQRVVEEGKFSAVVEGRGEEEEGRRRRGFVFRVVDEGVIVSEEM